MRYILALAIGIGIIALQVYLSRSKYWIFGGIIPLCFTIFTVWCFSFHTLKLSFSTVCPFILFIIALLSDWVEGRNNFKKKQQKELEKMKAKDL